MKQDNIGKFRKKSVVIEAVLWDGKHLSYVPEWIRTALNDIPCGENGSILRSGNNVLIFTLEGEMTASPGDWIIRGIEGEIYPCKPDIFEKTYEPTTSTTDAGRVTAQGNSHNAFFQRLHNLKREMSAEYKQDFPFVVTTDTFATNLAIRFARQEIAAMEEYSALKAVPVDNVSTEQWWDKNAKGLNKEKFIYKDQFVQYPKYKNTREDGSMGTDEIIC